MNSALCTLRFLPSLIRCHPFADDSLNHCLKFGVHYSYRTVVDVDLSKFFDRVNHDILIDRLKKRVNEAGVIWLVRAYLNAGIMDGGVVVERAEGTPQGGPLSPLLANVLLDEVDRELERRGHRFARYADDCNVYVRSRKAGERVMALLKRRYDKLHLKINESKSAVASAFGRKFLGYAFRAAPKGEVKRKVASQALSKFKQRIRELTRRSGGRSIEQVIEGLRPYVLGWKAYFGLTQTPKVWRKLDEWMRHRMRAIQLKHWRRGTTIYRELLALGAPAAVARQVAANSRRWQRNSRYLLNRIFTIAYFDRLGMPRLS
ncbi:group II intron reverse transcriptase/maturase [Massilia forsythiae]|uniref:Group II intron reverse transcriptase/maturase n=1 Tax=Massilia forsythiae TaxID=2728020 RepID=A0A7Z2W0G7_9BURK|nr:group II intron reverse transcriptase/maturase [Massilia forsythiae]